MHVFLHRLPSLYLTNDRYERKHLLRLKKDGEMKISNGKENALLFEAFVSSVFA